MPMHTETVVRECTTGKYQPPFCHGSAALRAALTESYATYMLVCVQGNAQAVVLQAAMRGCQLAACEQMTGQLLRHRMHDAAALWCSPVCARFLPLPHGPSTAWLAWEASSGRTPA
jgi:hypothetical protein